MRNWVFGGVALAVAMCGNTAVQAQGIGLSEVRGGIMAHSVDQPGPNDTFGFLDLTRIQDANVELLFTPPDWSAWGWIGSPRPMVGTTVNFGGLESMAYAGLTWHANLFNTPLFVEGSFGGAITNGASHGAVDPARNLGCPVLFHESASIGYDITDNADVMLTAEHASHAGLCGDDNRGLSNIGVRVGFKF
jgi:lipid A 3-O-deacylase